MDAELQNEWSKYEINQIKNWLSKLDRIELKMHKQIDRVRKEAQIIRERREMNTLHEKYRL